ncbi:MAG: phosphonate ABC transporter, permease protein PhnE [Planctomycetia bacterium]
MGGPSSSERPSPARARPAALLLDAAALAYGAWAADMLLKPAQGPSLYARWPWLPLAAVPLALLWQASDASLGQRAWSLARRCGGARAPWSARAVAGAVALLVLGAVLAPLLLLGPGLAGMVASLVLALALLLLALRDPQERSLAERVAGLHTVVVPPSSTGPGAWWRRPNAWLVLLLLGLTVAVGVRITDLDLARLFGGADSTAGLWSRLLDPDWGVAGKVAGLMVETVFVALMASLLALPLAFVLGFVAARNVMGTSRGGRVAHALVRILLNVARSMEPIVWATIFTLWVGIGPFAGMLALCVHSVVSLAKLYSEAIEGVDPGPVEAVRSTGAGLLPVLRYGMLPQVIPGFLSFTVYRWDINVRMATILGLVGGGGIGAMLIEAQQVGAWRKVGTIVVFITLVVWAMDVLSSRARRKVG